MLLVFFYRNLTPSSVAVYAVAVCVQKCELASMHTNRHRVHRRLQLLVRAFLLHEANKPFIHTALATALTPLRTQCTIKYPLLIF